MKCSDKKCSCSELSKQLFDPHGGFCVEPSSNLRATWTTDEKWTQEYVVDTQQSVVSLQSICKSNNKISRSLSHTHTHTHTNSLSSVKDYVKLKRIRRHTPGQMFVDKVSYFIYFLRPKWLWCAFWPPLSASSWLHCQCTCATNMPMDFFANVEITGTTLTDLFWNFWANIIKLFTKSKRICCHCHAVDFKITCLQETSGWSDWITNCLIVSNLLYFQMRGGWERRCQRRQEEEGRVRR